MTCPMTVTVLLGGFSAEREVSLATGKAVAGALRSLGHRVNELDPPDASWKLPAGTDVVFVALHGSYGEDGQVQQQLEEIGVPYTGCGPETSRVAFDKALTKKRCVAVGIPTPRYCVINSPTASWPKGWQPPVVLKPVRQGSSVGLRFVEELNEAEWRRVLAEAFLHDDAVLLEEKIDGRETTVAVLDGCALPVVEVRPRTGTYDYQSKYTPGATEYFCPAPLSVEETARLKEAALGAFEAVGGGDYARVDLMLRKDGEPMVLEVNTIPGMTETSLLPKAADVAGLGYAELCQRIIDLSLKRVGRHPSSN
jgi:D-alanine-D-alanine ligase